MDLFNSSGPEMTDKRKRGIARGTKELTQGQSDDGALLINLLTTYTVVRLYLGYACALKRYQALQVTW